MAILGGQSKLTEAEAIRAETMRLARQAVTASDVILSGLHRLLGRYGTDAVKAALGGDFESVQELDARLRGVAKALTGDARTSPLVVAPAKGLADRRADQAAAHKKFVADTLAARAEARRKRLSPAPATAAEGPSPDPPPAESPPPA